MLNWGVKDPDEILDYEIDWAAVGDSRLEVGETIATSEFTVVEGSVTIETQTNTTNTTTVWIAGGTLGERCTILNRVTTSAGRTYDLSSRLRIRSK